MSGKYLFHVTHTKNLDSIRREGLRSDYGRLSKRTWYADAKTLTRAFYHVAETHKWKPDDLVILRLYFPGDVCRMFIHRFRPGVYYAYITVRVTAFDIAASEYNRETYLRSRRRKWASN